LRMWSSTLYKLHKDLIQKYLTMAGLLTGNKSNCLHCPQTSCIRLAAPATALSLLDQIPFYVPGDTAAYLMARVYFVHCSNT
uniref:Uncharacterized protein n=1 Tax=Amphimedon queenslandica TaxID=400682 RepID=A0A1X7UJU7_AMPQE